MLGSELGLLGLIRKRFTTRTPCQSRPWFLAAFSFSFLKGSQAGLETLGASNPLFSIVARMSQNIWPNLLSPTNTWDWTCCLQQVRKSYIPSFLTKLSRISFNLLLPSASASWEDRITSLWHLGFSSGRPTALYAGTLQIRLALNSWTQTLLLLLWLKACTKCAITTWLLFFFLK